MEMTKEMIEQAKKLESADELIAFAKENGVELTTEQADEYYAKLHQTGELTDEELDNVAGGCGGSVVIESPDWIGVHQIKS